MPIMSARVDLLIRCLMSQEQIYDLLFFHRDLYHLPGKHQRFSTAITQENDCPLPIPWNT